MTTYRWSHINDRKNFGCCCVVAVVATLLLLLQTVAHAPDSALRGVRGLSEDELRRIQITCHRYLDERAQFRDATALLRLVAHGQKGPTDATTRGQDGSTDASTRGQDGSTDAGGQNVDTDAASRGSRRSGEHVQTESETNAAKRPRTE